MSPKKSITIKKGTHVSYLFYSFYSETLKFDSDSNIELICNKMFDDYIQTFNLPYHTEYKENMNYLLESVGVSPTCFMTYSFTTGIDRDFTSSVDCMSRYDVKYTPFYEGTLYNVSNKTTSVKAIIKLKLKVTLTISDNNLLKIKCPTLYDRLQYNITESDISKVYDNVR